MSTQPDAPATLAAALVAFQADMPTVTKGKTADTGKYRYTYADLASIVEAAMPILTRHGLAFTWAPRLVAETGRYELVGTLMHTSGEERHGALPLVGGSMQEWGSQITYARRYLFGCLTGVVTDDDDDGQAASRPATKRSRQAARREDPPAQREQEGTPAPTRRMAPPQPQPPTGEAMASLPQLQKLNILITEQFGFGREDREQKLAWLSEKTGREMKSSSDLTAREAHHLIEVLERNLPGTPGEEPPEGM